MLPRFSFAQLLTPRTALHLVVCLLLFPMLQASKAQGVLAALRLHLAKQHSLPGIPSELGDDTRQHYSSVILRVPARFKAACFFDAGPAWLPRLQDEDQFICEERPHYRHFKGNRRIDSSTVLKSTSLRASASFPLREPF